MKNKLDESAKREKAEPPCLKNAWVRKDADGYYYLYIRVRSGNSAIINLTAMNPGLDEQIKNEINPGGGKNDFIREVLDTWIAEQDNSHIEQQKKPDNSLEDFPAVIDG